MRHAFIKNIVYYAADPWLKTVIVSVREVQNGGHNMGIRPEMGFTVPVRSVVFSAVCKVWRQTGWGAWLGSEPRK